MLITDEDKHIIEQGGRWISVKNALYLLRGSIRNANKGAETDMLLVLEHLINSMINIAEFYIDFSNKTLERIKAQIEAENAGR
ncbi:MAG: hypothetical protein IJP56_00745 [Synergistaceae bacterium]|nr:hypothetical protein [Synergistaceae bacterium]MBQ6908570.1 hypothetical protein [Synergistaceae bacterium]MBR0043353.1 hypothetical protein [Synergistaceae bacterium]